MVHCLSCHHLRSRLLQERHPCPRPVLSAALPAAPDHSLIPGTWTMSLTLLGDNPQRSADARFVITESPRTQKWPMPVRNLFLTSSRSVPFTHRSPATPCTAFTPPPFSFPNETERFPKPAFFAIDLKEKLVLGYTQEQRWGPGTLHWARGRKCQTADA